MGSFENGTNNLQANYDGYVQINTLNKQNHGYEAGMSNGFTQVSTIEGKHNNSSMFMDY